MAEGAPGSPTVPVCYRHPGKETYIACQRCGRPICTDCMHAAAVGFQCPECVKEGAKQTRAGRTAYGGVRPTDATLTCRILVVANGLVWLLITLTGGARSEWVDRLALLPATVRYGRSDGTVDLVTGIAGSQYGSGGAYWQLVTSMFTHVSLLHVGFNMLALWILGPQLELVLGRLRFLAVYFLSGLTGSLFAYWLSGEFTQTIGASGAVFGLLGALLVVAIKVGGQVQFLLGWLAINVVITVAGASFISWQGHLGGFVGGVLLTLVMIYSPRGHRARWQAVGVGVVGVLLLAGIAARTVDLESGVVTATSPSGAAAASGPPPPA